MRTSVIRRVLRAGLVSALVVAGVLTTAVTPSAAAKPQASREPYVSRLVATTEMVPNCEGGSTYVLIVEVYAANVTKPGTFVRLLASYDGGTPSWPEGAVPLPRTRGVAYTEQGVAVDPPTATHVTVTAQLYLVDRFGNGTAIGGLRSASGDVPATPGPVFDATFQPR